MSTISVATYDVFANGPFQGNQLAVFTDCDGLSSEQMQSLAAEMNYAESTFLLKPTGDHPPANQLRYRIFTPEYELPFAGHPTLGTAYEAFTLLPDATEILLECTGGIIPVTRDPTGLLWMQQQPPKLEDRGSIDINEMAEFVGWKKEAFDSRFPAQVFSTGGTAFLVVAVKSLGHLIELTHTGAPVMKFCDRLKCVGIYLVTREGRDASHSVSARSMINAMSVPEDPATGSGCGCFAGWAMETGYLPSPSQFQVGQGHEMGRPSLLHVNVAKEGEGINVRVGGAVVPMIRGGRITLRPSDPSSNSE